MRAYNPDEDFAELCDEFIEHDGMDEARAISLAHACVAITLKRRREIAQHEYLVGPQCSYVLYECPVPSPSMCTWIVPGTAS